MTKIIKVEITKCGECPLYYGDITKGEGCICINGPDTIHPECPLEDAEVKDAERRRT